MTFTEAALFIIQLIRSPIKSENRPHPSAVSHHQPPKPKVAAFNFLSLKKPPNQRETQTPPTHKQRHVWRHSSWSSCRGAEGLAEEPPSCPYIYPYLCFTELLRNFLFWVLIFLVFWVLGFCCQARDFIWWDGEFDGVALHDSWQDRCKLTNLLGLWILLFLCSFYFSGELFGFLSSNRVLGKGSYSI